jgi:hypothetical protein
VFRKHNLLQQQTSRITTLRNTLRILEHALATSTASANQTFLLLAQSECLHLCETISSRLPRELRDIIYAYLLGDFDLETRITRDYFRSTKDTGTNLHTHDNVRWKAKHYHRHWWDGAFVGEAFYRELVETYCRTSTFVFGDDAGLIEKFLATDSMDFGTLPREMVMKVEVRLCAITTDEGNFKGYMFGTGEATRAEVLVKALESVEGLKGGASVVVRFDTRAKDEREREEQVERVIEVLVPGYRVRLTVDEKIEVDLIEGLE